METKTFYYWAVINHESFTFNGENYKVTREQLQTFKNLADELLESRDAASAQLKLPPYPAAEIDESYWEDLGVTQQRLDELLSYEGGSGNFYYYGTLPQDDKLTAIGETM